MAGYRANLIFILQQKLISRGRSQVNLPAIDHHRSAKFRVVETFVTPYSLMPWPREQAPHLCGTAWYRAQFRDYVTLVGESFVASLVSPQLHESASALKRKPAGKVSIVQTSDYFENVSLAVLRLATWPLPYGAVQSCR